MKMELNNFLNDIKVLDFSNRLPGPLSANLLAQLGAKVTKIEDTNYPDPFSLKNIIGKDESFNFWYQSLNSKKNTLHLDFKSKKDQLAITQMATESDIIIHSLPKKYEDIFWGQEKFNQGQIVFKLKATQNSSEPLHDINILAMKGILSLHTHGKNQVVIDPPLLPIAGINYAHKIAQCILAAIINNKNNSKPMFLDYSLEQSVEDSLQLLVPSGNENQFLHNGKFPAYKIYQTKDNYFVALAGIEQKFWNGLLEVFNIDLKEDDRFDTSGNTEQMLVNLFSNLTSQEIKNKAKGHHLCLTLFK